MSEPLSKRIAALTAILVARRKALGWSQMEVAERMNRDRAQISQWEVGIKIPRFAMFLAWCDALGMDATIIARDDHR